MNQVIDRIIGSGYVEDAQGNVRQPVSAVTFETGALLYDFVRASKPETTLEIGMAYGMSTLFICQALQHNGCGRHDAIDPFQESEFESIGILNVERAGLKHLLSVHMAPSDAVLPQLCAEGRTFDFAFIDGWHTFDFTLVDFYYVDKLLRVGAHVAFDDVWLPGVRKAISFVLKNKPYELVRLPSRYPAPLWTRALRIGRRIAQDPLERSWALKRVPSNLAVLKKVGIDRRRWDCHRAF